MEFTANGVEKGGSNIREFSMELKTTWRIRQNLDEQTGHKTEPVLHGQQSTPHKVVVVEPSEDLSRFKSSREMVAVVRDALLGHRHLFEKFAVIHGDVSGNNIRIMGKDKGALWDFDTRRKIIDSEQYAKINGEGTKERLIQELREFVASEDKTERTAELEQMLLDLKDAKWEELKEFAKEMDMFSNR